MASKLNNSTREDPNKRKSSFPFRYNDGLETLFYGVIKQIRRNADLHLLLDQPISQEPPKTEENAEVVGVTSNFSKINLENKSGKRDKNIEASIEKTVASIEVPTKKADIITRTVIKDLTIDLKTYGFTGIKWTVYGSYKNGLCTTHSDTIDLSGEYGEHTVSSAKNLVLKFSEFFKTSSLFRVEEFYEDALVPVIKLFHISTKKKVNITFFNEFAIRNLSLTKLYLSLNPNLRTLTLYLKDLMAKYELCGKFKITTHVLFWLVVYFLQEKGLLPSVKDIRKAATEKYFVSGWNCSVPDEFSQSNEEQPAVSSLLSNFFVFYKDFDFLKYVISPYHGCAFLIEEFERNLPVPEEAFNDVSLRSANSFYRRCFNIQDPVILNRNLTTPIHISVLNSFQLFCYRIVTDQLLSDLPTTPKKLGGYGNKPPNDFKRYVKFKIDLRDIPTPWWTDINRHLRRNVRKMMEIIFEFKLEDIVEQNITLIVRGKDGGYSENTSTVMYYDYCSTEKTWRNNHFLSIIFGESKSSDEPVVRNVKKDDDLGRVYFICEIDRVEKKLQVHVRSNDRMAKFLHKHFRTLLLFIFQLRCKN